MATISKTFLDLPGLQTYDSKIKDEISAVDAKVPTFSVNTTTHTLIINVPVESNSESET